MISDAPLGAFLSGGLDSSSVVAFAREINPEIQCFTYNSGGNERGMTDDLPYAIQTAKHLKVPLFFYRQHSLSMSRNEKKILRERSKIKSYFNNHSSCLIYEFLKLRVLTTMFEIVDGKISHVLLIFDSRSFQSDLNEK